MKKALPIVAVLLALGAGAFVFLQKRQVIMRVRATALAPAESAFFLHLPDLYQTSTRWPKTALAQIGQEPAVQTFLEKPLATSPWMKELSNRMEQITEAAPREAYVAVVNVETSSAPTFIAGFSFSGSRASVDELMTDARTGMRNSRPAGKADLVSYAGAEIETYTDKDFVIAETIRDGWYFVSNQLELLQGTLDRLDGKPGAGPSVLTVESYQKALAPLPKDADLMLFAKLDGLVDKLGTLMAAAGQPVDSKQVDELRKTQAISAAIKMDGAQMRDTVFILGSQDGEPKPLTRRGLDLSTAETLLYYVNKLPEKTEIAPEAMLPLAMVLPGIASLEQALAEKKLKLSDFGSIFGPELSVLVDWSQEEAQPSVLLGVEVRDSVRAKDFLDAAASGQSGTAGWSRVEEGDTVMYTSPAQAFFPGPILALAQNYLVVGLSQPVVMSGLERLKAKTPALGQTEQFAAAEKLVSAPTESFGFLDLRRLFERGYGMARPFLGMAIAFSPDMAKYIDAGKLPPTEAVAKHLTPSVYSQTVTAEGTLMESAGTLTFNQALMAVVGGGVAAALPTLQQTLGSGQGMPNLFPPGAGQPAPPVAPPAALDPGSVLPPAVPTPVPPLIPPAPAVTPSAIPTPESAAPAIDAAPAPVPSPSPEATPAVLEPLQ